MPPGQPHLLARRVERHRQSGQHPVAGADRVVLQEHPRFGVDERRGAAVGDRDTLRGAGGSGGEDDPGVVAAQRRRRAPPPRRAGPADQALLGDDADHVGLAEHQVGAFVGVVGVDRHVGRAGGQRREDRHVQRVAARRHPDADAVAAADAAGGQPLDALLDVGDQLGVGELDGAVVERGRVRDSGPRCRRGCRSACAVRARTATTRTARGCPPGSRCHGYKLLSRAFGASAPHGAWLTTAALRGSPMLGTRQSNAGRASDYCARFRSVALPGTIERGGEYSFAAVSSSRRPSSDDRCCGPLRIVVGGGRDLRR